MGLDKRLKEMLDSKKDEVEKKVDHIKDKVDDRIDDLRDSGKASFDKAKNRVEDKVDTIKDDAKDRLKNLEDKARDKVNDINTEARGKVNEIYTSALKHLLGSVIGGSKDEIMKRIAMLFAAFSFKSFIKNIPRNLYRILWNIPSNMKDDIRKIGDHIQFLTPIVVVLYCILDGNIPMLREFIIYYLICTAIQVLLKWAFNAPRPSQTDSETNPLPKWEWSVNRGDSFPSGHTMSAISGGLFWTLFAFGQPWVGIAGILLGLITALSRMIVRAHWLLDVGTSIIIASIVFLIMIS